MRFVSRPAMPPPALAMPEFGRSRRAFLEFLRLPAPQRAQTSPPDRHLASSSALLAALGAVFDNRCAFCESRASLSVYRFRPPSEALPMEPSPDAPLTYGWLADVWQNLYPICTDCRPRQPNVFPVGRGGRVPPPTAAEYARFVEDGTGLWMEHPSEALGARPGFRERPLLIDPCHDTMMDAHFVAAPQGELLARSRRGQATIDQFQLNRPALVAQRLRASALAGGIDNGAVAKLLRRSSTTLPRTRQIINELDPGTDHPGFVALLLLAHLRQRLGIDAPATLTSASVVRPTADDEADVQGNRWHLTEIEIANFKAIQSLKLSLPVPRWPDIGATGRTAPDELTARQQRTPALLILGENAAGKSSILEAVALAMLSPDALSATGQTADKLLLDTTYMGGDAGQSASGHVRLTYTPDSGKPVVRSLLMQPGDKGLSHDSGAPPPGLPVFAYGAFRHYLGSETRWDREDRSVISLFRSDNLLSNPDKWLYSLPQFILDRVVTALREVFGRNSTFAYIEKDKTAQRCLVVTRQGGSDLVNDGAAAAKATEVRTPLDAVSSGFRTILALTCDVIRWLMDDAINPDFISLNEARAVVLIDEVEAHLHPRWKVQIMDGLRRALPGVTFIATTHDPLCLRGMNDGEVKVLTRLTNADWPVPVRVEQLEDLPNVSLLTVDQLLTSELFRLFDIDDPTTAYSTASLADMLVRRKEDPGSLNAADRRLFRSFVSDIDGALPVGRSDVSRLVQDAVAKYLVVMRTAHAAEHRVLRQGAIDAIIAALRLH